MKKGTIWELRLNGVGRQLLLTKESIFMNSKNIDELIVKESQLDQDIESKLSDKFDMLSNIVNSDQMVEVPTEVKNYILELFSDMIYIVSDGKRRLVVRKLSGS